MTEVNDGDSVLNSVIPIYTSEESFEGIIKIPVLNDPNNDQLILPPTDNLFQYYFSLEDGIIELKNLFNTFNFKDNKNNY